MLLGTEQTLEDLLVRILTEHRSATVNFLHEEVGKRFRRYSVPAIYKELRKLEEHGVIFRQGKEVSLSLAWILNLTSLADRMYDLHSESREPSEILPLDDKKRTFRFSNLERLDDFWVHAIILMLQHSKRRNIYQWMPHPWFNLMHSDKSPPFHEALKVGGYSAENIVGGDTWLDRRAAKISVKGVYEYNFAAGPFQTEQSTYYSVTDTYLLTIKLPEAKAVEIDRLYQSTKSAADLDVATIFALISNSRGSTATIEKGGRQLKKIWNKCVSYFDVATDQLP